jgi:5-methylcytosine-specific restriction enzyme B
MKPSWAVPEVYDYFDAFLQTSILKNDSYLTNNQGVFSLDNLDECVSAFVDNPDTSKRDFDAKSRDQFSKTTKNIQEVFAHFIWFWGLPASDMTVRGKKNAVIKFLGDDYNNKLNDLFVHGGIGSAGQRHKLNKPSEIAYLLLLFREVKKNLQTNQIDDIPNLRKYIEKLCKELYYNNRDTTEITDEKLKKSGNEYLALHHIVLHLCDPQKYEAIAAQKHKNAIIETFFSLLGKDNADSLWNDIDESIFQIRKKLNDIFDDEINFYDDRIQAAWYFKDGKDDISETTLFEYKKAIVFYGPPGTSKTYSANRLAELLISKQYFRNKQNIKEYFDNSASIFDKHIHHLQLHSNYNYEDFIVGLHIENKGRNFN